MPKGGGLRLARLFSLAQSGANRRESAGLLAYSLGYPDPGLAALWSGWGECARLAYRVFPKPAKPEPNRII